MNPIKSIHKLLLALTTGVAYLALSSTVLAADSTNKGFLTFDGGVSLSQATTFHGADGNTKVSFDPGSGSISVVGSSSEAALASIWTLGSFTAHSNRTLCLSKVEASIFMKSL